MADTRRQDVEVERLVKAHNFKAAFKKIDGYIAKQAANKSHWLVCLQPQCSLRILRFKHDDGF